MHSAKTIALAVAPLLVAVNAGIDLDLKEVPVSCQAICRPIAELGQQCDVDLASDIDRHERLLQVRCVCSNKSFDVGAIAGLCADCMKQNVNERTPENDDDDKLDGINDINELMAVCTFASATYAPEATSQVQGITVMAVRPTDISQLDPNPAAPKAPTAGTPGSAGATRAGSGSMLGNGAGSIPTTGSVSGTQETTGLPKSSSIDRLISGASGSARPGLVSAAMVVAGAFVAGGMLVVV